MSELIFLDLEWNTTFYRNRQGERLPFHELIEVAAIKVEASSGAMLDSFHSYVRPKVSRKIENRTYRLLPYGREELRKIRGVGPKVAECVLLYGFHKTQCFPLDVWMKRAMAVLLPGFTPEDLGPHAGIAQQYLFHYSRTHPELFA